MTIPSSIIDRNLHNAEGLVMFGTNVTDMTTEELTACLVWATKGDRHTGQRMPTILSAGNHAHFTIKGEDIFPSKVELRKLLADPIA